MYTRSYDPDNERTGLPEGYSGNAMRDRDEPRDDEPKVNPWEKRENDERESEPVGLFGNLFPIQDTFARLFERTKLSLKNIGFEEILILICAGYLLFSREGDKECAIMLAALLFIS